MRKKRTAQSGEMGSVVMASGYATKVSDRPEIKMEDILHNMYYTILSQSYAISANQQLAFSGGILHT